MIGRRGRLERYPERRAKGRFAIRAEAACGSLRDDDRVAADLLMRALTGHSRFAGLGRDHEASMLEGESSNRVHTKPVLGCPECSRLIDQRGKIVVDWRWPDLASTDGHRLEVELSA